MHCGLCLPACPTYRVLRDENDSPRGRVYLMSLAADGRVSPSGAFAEHIDRCLGCRACEAACPAGVRFGSLLERARADRLRPAEKAGASWSLALLTGRASPLTYAILRTVRRSGIAAAGSRLRGFVGEALGWLAASAPAAERPSSARSATPPLPPTAPDPARTYALLDGCVMRGLFGGIHAATRRVLAASGFVERRATGQVCCGALHAHAGLAEEAHRLARRNIEAFERSEARWLVVDSAGCGAAVREYPDWLADSPGWRDRASRLAAATCDATRLVAAGPVPRAELKATAAYDAPCHLSYGLCDDDAPLEALSTVHGLEVERLPSWRRCCGGAGLFALRRADLARKVLEEKLLEIAEGEYELLLTGNPGCLMQIGAALRRAGSPTRAAHPIEVLDLGIRAAAAGRQATGRDLGHGRVRSTVTEPTHMHRKGSDLCRALTT